ncbi:uncharacterized protein OCT59_028805 [Rhizophagus irregularis]|uniref:uncharacterized protein n=1 Tax=Rhizophagus irregularis TaxID=588596 RepID=UPI00333126FE|nr:hypothetical protein OCT59_028805 [Rhizophagus irregularis]
MANKLIKKLLFDCLHEILENLENDITALHSCLSVNRLLCEISVRILWRVVVEYSVNVTYQPMSIVLKTILINCQYLEFIKIQYGDDFNDLNELMIYNSEFDFVHSRKLFTLTMILSDDFDNEHYEVQRQLYSIRKCYGSALRRYSFIDLKLQDDISSLHSCILMNK